MNVIWVLFLNQNLFQHFSDVLHLLEPQMYISYKSIKPFLLADVQPSCGVWYTAALNQNMVTDGEPHFDHNNYYCGLNAVTGWGDYTGAKLILWQLGLAIENRSGDAIMFLGRILTHNSVEIQGGARSMVDAFVHQAPLRWKDEQLEALTRYKRKGSLGAFKKEKGKGKKQARDEDLDDAENAENVENVEGQQDMDTDRELDAMYTLKLEEPAGEEEEED
ncbi:MAG: hypothetical protein M1839_000903 [Geoglossum umbratile]|nr:MAG: hypothetical protein M1839_000903 [Geoglossum umbratile]